MEGDVGVGTAGWLGPVCVDFLQMLLFFSHSPKKCVMDGLKPLKKVG